MKVLFLITSSKEGESISKETLASIRNNMQEEDDIEQVFITDNSDLYCELTLHTSKEFDFVCLVPNDSVLSRSFRAVIDEQVSDVKNIYLPLVLLDNKDAVGILNSCVWKYNDSGIIGILDHDLAKKQIDTTLYGALIPYSLFFDKNNYNFELKYYQHFYFLNSVTKKIEEVSLFEVRGIPKLLCTINIDLSHSTIDVEEKTAQYKLAAEKWEKESHDLTVVN